LPEKSVGWASKVLAVTAKDITTEFRTRYAVNAVVMFALVTLTAVSFALGLLQPSSEILAALFWVILFFAAMSGLAYSFIREEQSGTGLILRLSASGSVVLFGKMFFNFLLLLALTVLIVPLFMIFLKASPQDWPLFIAGVVLGDIGLAGATAIIAAIVSRATIRGALFTVLSFPVLLPLLVASIEISKVGFTGGNFSEIAAPMQLLVAYDVVMIVLSWLLFDFVWRR